jgi:hypothetical protein
MKRWWPRTITALGVVGAVAGLTAAAAGAQTAPGGGPFAIGMVTNVSGSALQLQGTNPQNQNDTTTAAVTLTDSTTYQKVQDTSRNAIAAGTCVRVNGKGSVDKGKITASTVAITATSSDTCSQTPGGGNGAPPGSAPDGAGNPPNGGSFPNRGSLPNGSNPPNGNNRPRNTGIAFGPVQSVKGDTFTVKATTFARPSQNGGSQDSPPKAKTKKVKVTLSDSTKVTETVAATQADVAAGECVSATGTGDSQAVTAERVTISQPDNGSCAGPGFGGGPPS